ncbi:MULTISPECIES: hypothetical protein [Lysobacter]|uniref:hypothetical protein n=1 Tax=Lysobacter TaxID=68 RepID=UPI001F3BC435|nr:MULTISPECIES: hypothetical protein [Lysobacter]UJB19221.1 hypothetical protein L1A79_23400 [Lysobacter capsici]UJQ27054.1 hypothetical protein L2D09_16485 [Lysobacter gummosus]
MVEAGDGFRVALESCYTNFSGDFIVKIAKPGMNACSSYSDLTVKEASKVFDTIN